MRTKITRIFVGKWNEIQGGWGKPAWWGCEIWGSHDSIKIRVFCDMASCSLLDVYKCFRGLDLLLRLTFWFYDDESLG